MLKGGQNTTTWQQKRINKQIPFQKNPQYTVHCDDYYIRSINRKCLLQIIISDSPAY